MTKKRKEVITRQNIFVFNRQERTRKIGAQFFRFNSFNLLMYLSYLYLPN